MGYKYIKYGRGAFDHLTLMVNKCSDDPGWIGYIQSTKTSAGFLKDTTYMISRNTFKTATLTRSLCDSMIRDNDEVREGSIE